MEWGNLVAGIGFISIGILVRFFPNLISGVSLMTQEEREKYDLKKFSKYLCNLSIGFGIVIGPCFYLLQWMKLYYIANNLILWGLPVYIILYVLFSFLSQIRGKK